MIDKEAFRWECAKAAMQAILTHGGVVGGSFTLENSVFYANGLIAELEKTAPKTATIQDIIDGKVEVSCVHVYPGGGLRCVICGG